MSLINKMLQDLDARGGRHGGPAERVPAVPIRERRLPHAVAVAGVAVGVLALLGAGGYYAWRYYKSGQPASPPAVTIVQGPLAPSPVARTVAASAPTPAPAREEVAPAQAKVASPAPKGGEAPASMPAAAPVAPAQESEPPVQAAAAVRAVPVGKTTGARTAPAREMTQQQRAESEYKRATLALQEGRVSEAIAVLQMSLQLEPRHDAARQTLVGLLVEARRSDEAIKVLQTGLALEPNQPNMAMLLARLQIEVGGPAIDTLVRTLPYAEGNAEYHAFLAGALQREKRHREAIEQYKVAVAKASQNGVWLMGLGISLAAERRNPEALDAFKRALASGSLTPELSAYVERRLQQLGR